MADYQNGKIYKIWTPSHDKVYVGSTCGPLGKRYSSHKSNFKQYQKKGGKYVRSYDILKEEFHKIELIEEYPCNSKKELHEREGYWIQRLNSVNKMVAGRGKKEYKKSNDYKKWYEDNKDKIIERVNKWAVENPEKAKATKKRCYEKNKEKYLEAGKKRYEENKEAISAQKKIYREKNKEYLKKKSKEWYEANKVKINAKYSEKVLCECGCEVSKRNMWRHKKTPKHLEMLANN